MIKWLFNILGIKNTRLETLKMLLQDLKTLMDSEEYHWSDTLMCTTSEGRAISRFLAEEHLSLNKLNDSFGERKYGVTHCSLFPVHNVVTSVYGKEVNARDTYPVDSREVKLLTQVRKELFNYWCEELIGEKL